MLKAIRLFSVFLIIIVYVLEVQARNIEYKVDVKTHNIKVSLITEGNSAESTKFKIPIMFELDKSQTQKIKTYVDDLEQNYSISNNILTITHKPCAKITVLYELSSNNDCETNLYFNLSLNYFFLFGKYFLFTPELTNQEVNDIQFKIFYSEGKIFSNINCINDTFYLKAANTKKLDNVFFIGGDIYKHKLDKHNSEIFFNKNVFPKKQEIVNFVSKVQSIHNNFFYKLTETAYYIFMSNEKNTTEGTQLQNIQVISLPTNSDFNPDAKRIISHENIHKWLNSTKFGRTLNDQGDNCWFIEGFTEYYTEYLNLKNNFISLEEYINFYNQVLQQYYTSPLKLITNQQLGDNIYDNDIFKIAYLRGRIIAHELNNLIRIHSDDKINLDDYMQYLVHILRKDKTANFNLNVFKKTLFDFTGKDFSEFIESVLTKNILEVHSKSILTNQAYLITKQFKKIVYDFDFLSSQLQWKVSGVNKDSATYLAGLRNGQKIMSIITDTDGLSFKILNSTNEEQIIKLPIKYESLFVPQYILKH